MVENKTVATNASVIDFLGSIDDPQQQKDSEKLVEIMSEITGEKPVMWGSSVVGFGSVRLKYASGREIDWLKIGFSPRKGKISLYVTFDASQYKKRLDDAGKYKIGKGCIYINELVDVDIDKLTAIIREAYVKEH